MSAKTTVAKGMSRSAVPNGQAALNEAWRVMHFALRAVIAEPDRILAARGLTRMPRFKPSSPKYAPHVHAATIR